MKKCFKCHQEKPLTEFYGHTAMTDGCLGKCKECTKADVKKHRAENLDKIRAYDRKRGHLAKRKKLNREYYARKKDDPEFKANNKVRRKMWLEKHAIKRAAHIICGNYKRDGKLISPGKCEQCDETENLNTHHEDYTKPLDVKWLCRCCHGKRHQEINELIRNGEDWSEKGF